MLRSAIKRLEAAKYLRDLDGGGGARFGFGENGVKLKDMLKLRLTSEVTSGELVRGTSVANIKDVQAVLDEAVGSMKNDAILNVALDDEKSEGDFYFDLKLGKEKEKNNAIKPSSEASSRMLTFFLEDKWKYVLHDHLRSRRMFWNRHLYNPRSLKMVRADTTTDYPTATISWVFEDQAHYDLPGPFLMERMRVAKPAEFGLELKAAKMKVVETTSLMGSGGLALLLDSVRKRQFLETTRLALHKHIVPFQTSIITNCKDPPSRDLLDLKEMLTLLAEEKGIVVYNAADTFDAADALGIPYAVVITEDSLEMGVVRIWDRETCWFEEIHVANVARRLVRIYRDEVVPNTWEEMVEEGFKVEWKATAKKKVKKADETEKKAKAETKKKKKKSETVDSGG
jgi:hypothetical protein